MLCRSCGEQVPGFAVHCPKCGAIQNDSRAKGPALLKKAIKKENCNPMMT